MYAFASFTENDSSAITVFEPTKNKLKLIKQVTLSEEHSNTITFDITKNNIFYSRLASSQNDKKHYKYDGEFVECDLKEDINNIKYEINVDLPDNEIVDAVDKIDDYMIAVVHNEEVDCIKILVIDDNTDDILDEMIMEDAYFSGMFYFYNDGNRLYLAISHDNKKTSATNYVVVVSVSRNSELQKYIIKNTDINELLDGAIAIPHKNYILFAKNSLDVICIYDYIKKEIVCINRLNGSGVNGVHGFVKLNDIVKETSMIEKIYNDNNKDVKIETLNGKVFAHKTILIHCSEYFKKLFSNNFENSKIKFNVEMNVMENIVKYMYLEKMEYKSVNELIKTYNLCDEILYDKLQNEIGLVLFDYFQLNEKFSEIKIYDKKFLNDLPKSIKVIKFDKNFNDDVDGLIKIKPTTLIFGASFKRDLMNVPDSVCEIFVNSNWNKKINKKFKRIKSEYSSCFLFVKNDLFIEKKLKFQKYNYTLMIRCLQY